MVLLSEKPLCSWCLSDPTSAALLCPSFGEQVEWKTAPDLLMETHRLSDCAGLDLKCQCEKA